MNTIASDIEDYKDLPIGATHYIGVPFPIYYKRVDMVWYGYNVSRAATWDESMNSAKYNDALCKPVPKIWSLANPKDLKPGDIVRIGDVTTAVTEVNKYMGFYTKDFFLDFYGDTTAYYFSFDQDRNIPVHKLIDNPQFKQLATKAEETTMTKQTFTKSDLKTGMRVTTTKNNSYIVMLDYSSATRHCVIDALVSPSGGWMDLGDYSEDLTMAGSLHSDFNISKVEQPTYIASTDFKVIWEPPPVETQEQKEYTKLMAQIEELKAQAEKLKP